MTLFVILTFRQYGISNDEEVQHRYGELIIQYYASGLADREVFEYKNLYLYGGLFDIIAVGLVRLLPFDVYLIRHLLTATIGLGGFVATMATARLISGPRAGLLAGLSLAVCGVWIGGLFNHTKDIPFAVAMIVAVYFLLRTARDLPSPRWRDTIGFGLALGAALGLRALALLLLGYAVAAIALAAYRERATWRDRWYFCIRSSARLLPGLAIAYAIMGASWPWALLDPLNPIRAIVTFAHFHYQIHTIIAGTVYEMADVPRWYIPTYLLIKLPIVMLVGAALAIGFAIAQYGRRHEAIVICLVTFIPILCFTIFAGPAFTGMRHFLFVVPPLAVLSGVGFDAVLTAIPTRLGWLHAAGAAAIGLALLWPASVLVRLHPYEYLFYNQLVNGLPGAARRYVMDYWVNIMPEAVGALQDYLNIGDSGDDRRVYTVAVCGEKFAFENYADKRLQATGWWELADFFIAPTHMNCDRSVDGKVIATIQRLGVPIGVVKDRRIMLAHPGFWDE